MTVLEGGLRVFSSALIVLVVIIVLSDWHLGVLSCGFLDWLQGVLGLYPVLYALVEIVAMDYIGILILV
jgi:hypothetical protein